MSRVVLVCGGFGLGNRVGGGGGRMQCMACSYTHGARREGGSKRGFRTKASGATPSARSESVSILSKRATSRLSWRPFSRLHVQMRQGLSRSSARKWLPPSPSFKVLPVTCRAAGHGRLFPSLELSTTQPSSGKCVFESLDCSDLQITRSCHWVAQIIA